jgi:hypothetical protein
MMAEDVVIGRCGADKARELEVILMRMRLRLRLRLRLWLVLAHIIVVEL